MKYSIIYSSHTGNTKLLAESIQNLLGENCIYFGEPDEKALEADVIFVGFWTDKGNCSDNLAAFMKKIENKKIFIFGTAGFGGAQSYFDRILLNVESNLKSSNNIIGRFMCQGKMGMAVRKRYESMLEKNPNDEGAKRSIENFDMASVHPDVNDISELKKAVEAVL